MRSVMQTRKGAVTTRQKGIDIMKITTVSLIGKNDGEQYISGMLEDEKFDEDGLWHNTKAFCIDLYHKTQTSKVIKYSWYHGMPSGHTVVKVYRNNIIDVSEVEAVLKECNLI